MSRYSFSMGSNPGRQGWFRAGEVEVTTTALVCAGAVISLFVFAIQPALLEPLIYTPQGVRAGEIWRVVTWPLANVPDIWQVISIVVFWFVGHLIEDEVGRKRFAVLVTACAVIPALLVTLVPITSTTAQSEAAAGLGLLVLAFIVVYAVQNPQAPSFFGIPIWILASVYVGIQVLFLVGVRAWAALLLMLAVIAVACVGAAAYGVLPRLSWVPQVGAGRTKTKRTKGRKRAKGKRGAAGNVTPGPWSGSSTGGPTRLETAELDVLLEKIAESGVKSLTKHEQQRLDELSRKMRDS